MDERTVLSELEEMIQTGAKLGILDDREGRQLLNCIEHGIVDSFVVERIRKRVEGALRAMAKSGCPLLRPRLHRGDFVFGWDLWGRMIMIFLQYFNAHTLLVASTGSGKTNLPKYQAALIAPRVRGLWLIDLRKREYRVLSTTFDAGVSSSIFFLFASFSFLLTPVTLLHLLGPLPPR